MHDARQHCRMHGHCDRNTENDGTNQGQNQDRECVLLFEEGGHKKSPFLGVGEHSTDKKRSPRNVTTTLKCSRLYG